ncbi:S-layer homology domain-containing protein [Jeotgalibacillus sp. JSM ZJ347]|uniref:S-layer homology domain-containing protein n=1 Tax=Jeotgalibacillus sp. JSM ZJ347 TaxID=3342117 RepID=UPI0035A86DF5
MNKRIAGFLAFLLAVTLFAIPANTASADDDITGLKLEAELRAIVEAEVMAGYGEGEYRPKEEVTRGQFAAFISRALGLPDGESSFNDVPVTSKLYDGISRVTNAGIMSGLSSTHFGMNNNITREQIALTLENTLAYLLLDEYPNDKEFSDKADFKSSVSYKAVKYASFYNVISGKPNSDGTFRFEPKATALRDEAAAFIYRTMYVAGILPDGVTGPEVAPPAYPEPEEPVDPPEVDPEPEPEPEPVTGFRIGKVVNGQMQVGTTEYKTYEQALSVFHDQKATAILKDGRNIKINAGIAVTYPNPSGTTTIYKDNEFKEFVTYVQQGREMRYFDSNETAAKVQIGSTIGYARVSEVDLLPLSTIEDRDYYTRNAAGEMTHYALNHLSGYYGVYSIGPAPSFMKEGEKYFSWDGVKFTNARGELQGTHYPYFQFLNARSKTNYTAKELDQHILARLTELESLAVSKPGTYGRYKDATKKSKLLNLGTYLKEQEQKKRVNALFILAAATHESDYGMSNNALTKNNIFGIKVFDSSPEMGEMYEKPERSVDAFLDQYMNKNYIPTWGAYAHGGVSGNKTIGMNVRYASDPNWGSKIAGHMNRMDKALGRKDLNQYTRALTNGQSVIARTDLNNSDPLTTYEYKAGRTYPVIITGEVTAADGTVWTQILSDTNLHEHAYVRKGSLTGIPN